MFQIEMTDSTHIEMHIDIIDHQKINPLLKSQGIHGRTVL